MKLRKLAIITALLAALVMAAFATVELFPTKERRDLRAARAEARSRGFKLGFENFNLRLTPEEKQRAERFGPLSTSGIAESYAEDAMQPAGPGLAIRLWPGTARQKDLAESLQDSKEDIDRIQSVILEGHRLRLKPAEEYENRLFGTHMTAKTAGWTTPHEWSLDILSAGFTARAAVALEQGRPDEAWTNLLALHLMAARYDEPFFRARDIRSRLVETAFAATWEYLQAAPLNDGRLGELEHLWTGIDLLRGSDEVCMAETADWIRSWTEARRERDSFAYLRYHIGDIGSGRSPSETIDTRFRSVVRKFRENWEYDLHRGPAREAQCIRDQIERRDILVKALACRDWRSTRGIPGVGEHRFARANTQTPPPPPSPLESMLYLGRNLDKLEPFFFRSLKAEARRRILLAVLAVEHTRHRLGRLPETLADAGDVPSDIMTGEPLIYRTHSDGTYLIYSPGYNLIDEQGEALRIYPEKEGTAGDIAWPRCVPAAVPPKPNASQ